MLHNVFKFISFIPEKDQSLKLMLFHLMFCKYAGQATVGVYSQSLDIFLKGLDDG